MPRYLVARIRELTKDRGNTMKAKCGHDDALGYFAGTVCGKCAKANHAKAVGK